MFCQKLVIPVKIKKSRRPSRPAIYAGLKNGSSLLSSLSERKRLLANQKFLL
jgi:hypothetical protein